MDNLYEDAHILTSIVIRGSQDSPHKTLPVLTAQKQHTEQPNSLKVPKPDNLHKQKQPYHKLRQTKT